MKRRIGKLLTIVASSLALFGLMGCDETTSTTTTSNITTTNTIIPIRIKKISPNGGDGSKENPFILGA